MADGDANDHSKVFRFEVKLEELEENEYFKVQSEVKRINGFPLKLRAVIWDPLIWDPFEDVSAELVCDRELMESNVWECDVEGEMTLVNRTNYAQSQSEVFDACLSNEQCNWYAIALSSDECYIAHNKLLIEAKINVKGNADRFRKRRQTDFYSPSKYSDVCLIVEGNKFYTSKQILAHASPYFEATFFGKFKESRENEIYIEDISAEEFLTTLQLIYDTGRRVNGDNVEYLLKIADRFDIPKVMILAEERLMYRSDRTRHEMLLLSDQYNLCVLQTLCLSYISKERWPEVMNSDSYKKYSNKLKNAITDAMQESPDINKAVDDRFNKIPQTDFYSPSRISDVILLVDGKKFHASKQILAHASSHFEKLFYDELKDSNEIGVVIDNISSEEFLVALEFIYNYHLKVDDAVVEILLKMGERFEITGLMDRAELHLISARGLIDKVHLKLRLADQYNLEVLKRKCLRDITTCKEIKNLKRSESFKHYSHELKEDLLEKVAEICEKEEEEEE